MLELSAASAGRPGNTRFFHPQRTGARTPAIALLVLMALADTTAVAQTAVAHIAPAGRATQALLTKAVQTKRQQAAIGSRPAVSRAPKAQPVRGTAPQAKAAHVARPGSPQQAGRRPVTGPAGRRPMASRPTAGQAAQKRSMVNFNNLFSGMNHPGSGALPFSMAMPSFNFPSLNLGQMFQQQPAPANPLSQHPQPAPAPVSPPTPQPVVQPAPQSGPAAVAGGDPFQAQELNLINQYRQQNGRATLAVDPNLTGLAVGHSQDMANRQNMDHNGFDQRFQQAQQWGYTHCVENVAWNYNDPQSLFTAWQNSPEHNINMLDSAIQKAGVSIVNGYSTFLACN